MADTRSVFYVYALFHEDGTPFYIGKGCGGRWLNHEQRAVRGRSLKDDLVCDMRDRGVIVPKEKLITGMSNDEACTLEIDLIALVGRAPYGPLVNISAGGKSTRGMTGKRVSETTKQKMRDAATGRVIPAEVRLKIGQAQKGKRRGPPSPQTKEKIAASQRGRSFSDDHRKKLSMARRSYSQKPGTLAKISASMKLVWAHRHV